jgi:hypothetical protein
MKWLVVKGWQKHQHYKDRFPPWIKLHQALLDDYEFGRLQDASKAHLMLIWVLASRDSGRVRNDPDWIAQRIGATSPVDVQVLIESGFLVASNDASAPLAERKQVAPRGEERREEKNPPPPPAEDGEPMDGATAILARVPNPTAWRAAMRAMTSGMPGHESCSADQLERACVHLDAQTAPGQTPSMNALAAFVRRIKQSDARAAEPRRERQPVDDFAAVTAKLAEEEANARHPH